MDGNWQGKIAGPEFACETIFLVRGDFFFAQNTRCQGQGTTSAQGAWFGFGHVDVRVIVVFSAISHRHYHSQQTAATPWRMRLTLLHPQFIEEYALLSISGGILRMRASTPVFAA